jgi:nucleotide-binding universal stress UspA family protein
MRRRQVMEDVKKVMVVTRMTRSSRKAVHYGVSLAKKYGCELYVLHVIDRPFGTDLEGWSLPLPSIDDTYKKIVEEEQKELDRVIEFEKDRGLPIKKMIKEGKETKEILKAIEKENIDLLVIPSHSESRLEHLLFGRSNDEIIRTMACSTFLVKEEPREGAYED